MANIRKTFNFREGVKVDSDVLVVTGSRVGVGTSTPISLLDVKGTSSITNLKIGAGLTATGISTFNSDVKIGTGITIQSSTGIITANKFYGDGSTLSNIPTSRWISTQSGIHTLGNVGVGTTNPLFDIQVGGDPNTVGEKGIGIHSSGNLKTSGIITASKYYGDGSSLSGVAGNIGGATTISLDTGIPISFSNGRLEIYSNNPDGVIKQKSTSGELQVQLQSTSGTPTSELFQIKGLSAGSGISANFRPASGIELYYNTVKRFETTGQGVNISGVCTATTFVGNLTGTASTATVALSLSQGASYTAKNIIGGIGSFGSIGIGTTNPATDIQIVNSGNSVITLGRSDSATGNNGAIGFGKVSNGFPYSNANSLDILNYGTGNVNFYLEAGSVGVNTGDFYWHRRGNYGRLMTLTYGGSLGIGITTPLHNLHVVGTSTVTSNAYFGNDVGVGGDVNVVGGVTAHSFSGDGSALTGVSGDGYWNKTQTGINTISNVGIGTTNPRTTLQVGDIYGVSSGMGTFVASAGVAYTCNFYDTFKNVEYTFHIGIGTKTQSQKVLIMHNEGGKAFSQEYGVIYSNEHLVSIGATLYGANTVEVLITPEPGISGLTTYRFIKQSMR